MRIIYLNFGVVSKDYPTYFLIYEIKKKKKVTEH
jgi:hypothetical protein